MTEPQSSIDQIIDARLKSVRALGYEMVNGVAIMPSIDCVMAACGCQRGAARDALAVVAMEIQQRGTPARWDGMILPEQQQIYFAEDATTSLIKIGYSTKLHDRLKKLGTKKRPLLLRAALQGDTMAERALHKRFAAHRVRGEWFAKHPEIEAFIASLNGADCIDC